MTDADRVTATVIALAVGTAAFVAAGFLTLLQRTQGIPPIRRIGAMRRVAGAAVWAVLPARRTVAPFATGFLAFVGSLAAGLALTFLMVWLISPKGTHPTEAYEGFGDAVTGLFCFGIGAGLSLCVAVGVGVAVSEKASLRWPADAEPGATVAPPHDTVSSDS